MKLFLFISLMFFAIELNAQTIDFNFNDGSLDSYTLEDVRKITFDEDIMKLHLWDETIFSWDISSIAYYEYNGNIAGLVNFLNDFELEIFPNPAFNVLKLNYSLTKPSYTNLKMYNMNGKLVLSEHFGLKLAGINEHTINLDHIEPGTYNIILEIDKVLITRKLIKK